MPLVRAARVAFLAWVFALPFHWPAWRVGGAIVMPGDPLFLLAAALWALALASRQGKLRWDRSFALILAYFVALALSAVFSEEPRRSLFWLAGIAYLTAIPVLAINLLQTEQELRNAVRVWVAATAAVVATGLLSFVLFYVDRGNPLLSMTLYHVGSLPPGDYPRFQLTFRNANALCTYLTAGLMLLLAAARAGILPPRGAVWAAAGFLFCAFFTLSPGLGGIALAAGLWGWAGARGTLRGSLMLSAGIGAAGAFLAAAAVELTLPLAPSPRLQTWAAGIATFLEHPLNGVGVGVDPLSLRYVTLSGRAQLLQDPHNSFINVAAQAGLPGLLALVALVAALWARALPFRLAGEGSALRVGLGAAFLATFVYQGLTGSFEESRHLWALIGLVVAAAALEPVQPNSVRMPTSGSTKPS